MILGTAISILLGSYGGRIDHGRTFIGDNPSSSDHTFLASGNTERSELVERRDDFASRNARLGQRHRQQNILTGAQMVPNLSSDVPGQRKGLSR